MTLIHLSLNILKSVGDTVSDVMENVLEIVYGKSNGYVTDDVT